MAQKQNTATMATQVPATSQVESCYRLLRGWIVSCTRQPGERLTEKDLIKRTGFGRTPVREALLRLNHDGLIQTLPRSGYRVAPLTEKTINDLYDIWRLLGPLIARLAYHKMTPVVRQQIAALDLPAKSRSNTPPQELSWRMGKLFEIFVAATENEQLIYIFRRLAADMDRMFVLLLRSDLGQELIPEEGALEELSKSTDPDAVAARVAEVIAASYRGIIAAYRQGFMSEAPPKRRTRKK